MKLNIAEIKPNPFKKQINKGKLSREAVDKIKSNMKELGLMGALPVFKKDDNYYLVNGHHRLQAIKEVFGKDTQIEAVVHKYTEDNVLRGMVVENLTQRDNEHLEESQNILLIEDYLKKVFRSPGEHNTKKGRWGEGRPHEQGSIRDIANWLNKVGEVMSIHKISEIIRIERRLAPDIKARIKKVTGGKADEDVVTKKQAVVLSSIPDHKEQHDLLDAMKKEDGRPHELIQKYKEASPEIKEKVRKGELLLSDMKTETELTELKNKMDENKNLENNQMRIIKAKEIVNALRSEILDTHAMMDSLMHKVNIVRRKGFNWYDDKSKKDFKTLISDVLGKVQQWEQDLLKIQGEVEQNV